MIKPTCPKCGSSLFAVSEFAPQNSNYKLFAVHCKSCGAVVGVLPFQDIPALIYTLAEKLKVNLDD
jgi:uncharacterized OB-fold protein